MGRPAMVSLGDAINVVKDFMEHFITDELPSYTSNVWKDISEILKKKWSPHNVYTHVRENRRQIMTTAREEMGIVVPKNVRELVKTEKLDETDLFDASAVSDITLFEDSSFNSSNGIKKMNTHTFDLVLSQEHWDAIKPKGTVMFGSREKHVLTPRVWTNILDIEFWKQHKMNCAFLFKRGDISISPDGLSYDITVVGRCKSMACDKKLVGKATKSISELGGLILQVETRETREEIHEEVKRPFNGKRRRQAEKELKTEGCSGWKKRKAREYMEIGDVVPPFLPNNNILRQAKKEGVDRELNVRRNDARDLI